MEDDQLRVVLYPFPQIIASAIKTLSGTLQRFEQCPQGGTPHFLASTSTIAACTNLVGLTLNIDNPISLERISLPLLEELDLSQEYDVRRGDYAKDGESAVEVLCYIIID